MAEEKLKRLLEQFERNKEWADLVNWLNKVMHQVKELSGKREVPMEDLLAKRLSQCLNQSLPIAVHSLTLDTYGLIFDHHCQYGPVVGGGPRVWGNSLAYYSPGLFSFYQFAKLEVKLKFNDLIKRYYLQLGAEILHCLNGLVTILMLGLDDSNEDAIKGIEEILQMLERKIGTRMFYGSLWLAILRTSKIRYTALKYIHKAIPCTAEEYPIRRVLVNQNAYKVSNYEEYSNELVVTSLDSSRPVTEEELLYYFYPQKSQLVVNAIIQSLQDEVMFTQRSAFDFLITHMPLKSDILSFNEKVCLVEAGCYLLLKKNDSLYRRFYSWVLGERGDSEEDFAIMRSDVSMKVFVKAMHNLFTESPSRAISLKAPIEIIKTIFEDNEGLTEKLLPDIASAIVRYLEKHNRTSGATEDIAGSARKFLNSERQLILIWQALGSELSELMCEQNYKKVLETINLIKYFLTAHDTTKEQFASKSKYLKPIFSRILMSMGSLSNNLVIMSNTIPGLRLIQEILVILEKEAHLESFGLMAEGIKKFVAFYRMFIGHIIEGRYEKDEESWKSVEEAFALATRNVVALQAYVDLDGESTDWLNQLIHCVLDTSAQSEITLICIEGIISIYEEEKRGGTSYAYLKKCVTKESAIVKRLWDMIGQSPNDRKVVELIKRADTVVPMSLSDCVINELLDESTTARVAAINRFSLFWKLAAEYHPSFIPFSYQPLCLFHMIDFLNNDHPLVRHSSKSWLAESTRRLERIIDPIIRRILHISSLEEVNGRTGQLIHNAPYETRFVIDAFKRLRSILITNKTDLMAFMMSTDISSELLEMYNQEKAKQLFDLLSIKKNYLQFLLFLSLKYIRGQTSEKLNQEIETENAAVNACGCEFLELILTSVEPNDASPVVAECVIGPLIVGLYNSFITKDSVMQVEILKIIRLIQFKCTAQTKVYAENCMRIFYDPYYMMILGLGLESDVSYVRSSYISYVQATLPLYTTFLGEKLPSTINVLMVHLSNNLANCSSISSVKAPEERLIANENDILQVLTGVKSVIHHYFFDADKEVDREDRVSLQKAVSLPSGKKCRQLVESIRNVILDSFGGIIIRSLRIWKHPSPKLLRDFKLCYLGVLPFTSEDYDATLRYYHSTGFTFENVEKEFTSYQEALISIIQPIIERKPKEVIRSVVDAWLREQSSKNDEALRKIIDILVLLRVPIDNMIQGISFFFESPLALKSKKVPAKGPVEIQFDCALQESSICLLLYSYLLYNYEFYGKKYEKPADKVAALRNMWMSLHNLFKHFLQFRSPMTLCWLFDIMYLMGLKYDPRDATTQESKVRRSLENIISQLAQETALISSNSGSLRADERFNLELPYNPSFFNQFMNWENPDEERKVGAELSSEIDYRIRQIMPQFKFVIPKPEGSVVMERKIVGEMCTSYLRGCCFLTMNVKLYDLTLHILGACNKAKMGQVLSTVMESLFPLLAQREEFIGEYAADVLNSILITRDEFMAFRKHIVEIFYSDEFFCVNQRHLKKWKLILERILVYDKNELFNELIRKMSEKSLISSKAYEMSQKYMALKRLAFLILSGKNDHFEESYSIVLTKLMEGIRDAEYPKLVVQYLTLLRVMLLRFGQLNESSKETAKNMQTLWPNILCKLIQIFQDPDTKSLHKPMVILAALRLIEIMSVLNIEDHTLFQWAFLNDSFGWHMIKNEEYSGSDKKEKANDRRGKEAFMPFCISTLSTEFAATFMNEKADKESKVGDSLHKGKENRLLIFLSNVKEMTDLTQYIISYICYLSSRNMSNTELNLEMIEDQIEKDFVSTGSDTISKSDLH